MCARCFDYCRKEKSKEITNPLVGGYWQIVITRTVALIEEKELWSCSLIYFKLFHNNSGHCVRIYLTPTYFNYNWRISWLVIFTHFVTHTKTFSLDSTWKNFKGIKKDFQFFSLIWVNLKLYCISHTLLSRNWGPFPSKC